MLSKQQNLVSKHGGFCFFQRAAFQHQTNWSYGRTCAFKLQSEWQHRTATCCHWRWSVGETPASAIT